MKYIPHTIGAAVVAYVGFLFGNTYGGNVATEHLQTKIDLLNVELSKEREVIKTLTVTALPLHITQWQVVDYDTRKFFFTDEATPSLFQEPMTYIWNERGCYAFEPSQFTLEEIYELVMKKNKKPKTDLEKYNEGTELRFSI